MDIWRCAIKWFNCTRCKNTKMEDDFYNDKNRSNGKTAQCKACMKEGLDRERRREYEREYKGRHPEKRAAIARNWYEKNKSHHKATREAYLKTEQGRATYRKYTQKRYALRKEAFVEPVDVFGIYQAQDGICYLCGSRREFGEMHADHVIPLSKGGKHETANIKMACAKCNLSKGAKEVEVALVQT